MAPKQRKKQQSAAKSARLRGRQGSSFASCPWCKTSVAASLLKWHVTECASCLHQRQSEDLQKLNLEENARVEDLNNGTSREAEGREVDVINLDEPCSTWSCQDDAVRVLHDKDDTVRVIQIEDDAVTVVQNIDDLVRNLQNIDDVVMVSRNEGDAAKALQNKDDPIKTLLNIEHPVRTSQTKGDAVMVLQNEDDPVRASQNIDDAIMVLQNEGDAVKVSQNKDDPVRASQNIVDAIVVSEGDPVTVLQKIDDLVRASQNIDDAVMFSQNEGDAVMLLQNKDDPFRALHTKDDAVMLLQSKDDAITVLQSKENPVGLLQKKDDPVGVLHEKDYADRVFQNKDDDVFGVLQDKDDPVNVLQASSAVAESEQEVKNPGCIPSMQNTDCVKSTQFTLAQTSVSASEGLPPRDPLEEKSLCCKCRKSLPLHCKGSIERSLSESAVCKRDCMPFSEGPEADEATTFSSLQDALTKLEKEHDALICLQEATEKKNQELLLREQESQRELWLLQQRHEEVLKSLQSMKEKLDSLSVPSSSLKGNKLSVYFLSKDLIGTGDCATTSSDKQRTEYCNGSIDMKKAYEVVDRFIEGVQSDEVGSSPHKGAPITGASSSVSELAKQEGESYALETCTDAPNQNAADSGLPLLTYATAVEKLSIPCMSPLTPDRRALFCCIDKDISERKCTTVQNREGRSEAINKIPESLGPDTPEKTVPHVAGCHPFRTFTTSVPNTSTIEKDVSCSTCRDKDVPAEEAPNANLEPSTLFSSAEAPAYLQRAKEPRENLQAACLDKDLVQTSAGKSFLLGSSPQDFFPAKEFLKDLEFVAHEDLDSFGTGRKARATMGCGNARRRIIAESSDSESGRDVIGNSRPKKRAFRNHLDSENENQFAYSKERIIPIPSDSESGEEDRGYLKDSCYCEPSISDEVLKETPVLKRLKKFGSINLLEMINNQALEEAGVAADKLGSSISKGEGQRDVLNIGGARRRRRRIFQDSEDEAGNSCHDRQQLCEELEEEEIDPHPAKSKTLSSGKSVVGKMHLPGTSDSSENPKGYWLRRFGKRRLSYSEAPILEDGSTGEASSHGQKVQRHKRHVKEKVKLHVNLLKESSGSEGEDEIEEESEGESLKGFIVDEIEESEDWSKPNSLSENRSTDGLEDICSASTDELQCSSCSSESSQNGKFNWAHEAQFLAALGRDDELCLHAVCALYRQQTYSEQMNKSALIRNRRGFDRFHASKASVVAEFLTDGDYAGELKKSVMDLKRHDPQGIEYCRDIAFHYSKQLFEIYQNGEDSYFCARTEC